MSPESESSDVADTGGGEQSDVYRDDRKYDKCKWERAWGEFNASLHARMDADEFLSNLGDDDPESRKVVQDIIEDFTEIAEKHGVETFEECWNGEVEECDEHEVSPP